MRGFVLQGLSRLTAIAALLAGTRLPAQELTIGSPAPALDITHWLKGEPITSFEPGRVYLLEFWATWCGPCVGKREHLSALATDPDQSVHRAYFDAAGLSGIPAVFVIGKDAHEQATRAEQRATRVASDAKKNSRAYFATMLARIHAQRGEYEKAIEVQAKAVALLEAMRPKIEPHERKSFVEDLAARQKELADYKRQLRGG
jgi:thiol-disulfide isomerase/thioredoxin